MAQGEAVIRFLSGDFSGAKSLYTTASQGFDDKINSYFGGTSAQAATPTVTLVDPSEGWGAYKQQEQQAAALRKLFDGKKTTTGGSKSGKSEVDELARAYQRMNERLTEQVALHGDNSAAAKLEYDLTLGSMKGLGEAQKQELRDKQAKLDLMDLQAEADKAALDLVQKHQEAEKDRQQAFKEQKADMEFELSILGLTNKERARAIELRYLGVDAASEEGKAIGAMSDKLYDQSRAMRDLIALQDDMRDAFADNFYDLVTGAKSAKDAVKDFFDSVASSVLKMISQNFAASLFGEQGQNGGGMFGGLMSSISGGMTGSGSSGGAGGGFWNSLIGGIGSMFGGSKAVGGDVLSGRGYWVGEEGPEWFEPRGTGTIIPTAAAIGAGGGKKIVQNLNVSVAGRPDRRTPQQIARESGREAARAMSRTGR